jgi:hypothetical protein
MRRWTCRSSVLASIAVAGLTFLPATAPAQTCLGTAPLQEASARIGVVAAHNERARSVGASLTAGVLRGLFVGASHSRLWIDVAEDPVPAFVGTAGFSVDIPLPRDAMFQACPFATYETVDGHEVDLGPAIPRAYAETHAFRGGLALGGTALRRLSFAVVPTVSLSFVREVATLRQAATYEELSDDYGLLDGGVGIVFGRIFTAQATLSMPVWIRGMVPTYGLFIGMNFGGPEY